MQINSHTHTHTSNNIKRPRLTFTFTPTWINICVSEHTCLIEGDMVWVLGVRREKLSTIIIFVTMMVVTDITKITYLKGQRKVSWHKTRMNHLAACLRYMKNEKKL